MSRSPKEVILDRIRGGSGEMVGGAVSTEGTASSEAGPPVPRGYRNAGSAGRGEVLERFAERVSDYRATMQRVDLPELPGAAAAALRSQGVRRLVIPAELPESWLESVQPGTLDLLRDGPGEGACSARDLASCQGVLTGCAMGIAETGTIVLDSGPTQGRRALTLLPDFHLCVVFGDQVVETVPEAVGVLGPRVAAQGMPLTLVSGPSATSDIELIRVEGVHGPRTLWVILVEGGS